MNNIKQPQQPAERVIREAECRQLTGICRTTRYVMEKRGAFPPAASWEVVPLVGFCLRSQHGSRAAAKQREGWGMSHKTKAAMQGRQCHYQKLKQSQDTGVNAGGQSLSAPVISGTAPLAHTPFPQIWGDLEQRAGSTAIQHTPEISRSFDRYPNIGYRCEENRIGQNQSYKIAVVKPGRFPECIYALWVSAFGSMPRCCNSLRIIRFIHADTEASPSCARACLIPSSRFGSTRNAICLLPLALISMVDIWLTPDYFEMVIKCMTGAYQKQRPGLLEQYQASNQTVNRSNSYG